MAAAAIGSSTATTIALITAAAKEVGQKVESTLAPPFLSSAARSSVAAARGVTVTVTTWPAAASGLVDGSALLLRVAGAFLLLRGGLHVLIGGAALLHVVRAALLREGQRNIRIFTQEYLKYFEK
jgi:hypothetical protein